MASPLRSLCVPPNWKRLAKTSKATEFAADMSPVVDFSRADKERFGIGRGIEDEGKPTPPFNSGSAETIR